MLHRAEEIYDRLEDLADQVGKGTLDSVAAAGQMLELAPGHAPALLLLAVHRRDAGDFEGAVAELWKAINASPCGAIYYLTLAETLENRNGREDPEARSLRRMAMQKLAGAEEIPPEIAELFEEWDADLPTPLRFDFTDPETYRTLEDMAEALHKKEPAAEDPSRESTELETRLLPYQLLADLQAEAPDVVAPDTLRGILSHGERCLPLLRAALREWAERPIDLAPDALCLVVAILGEIGTPQDFPDLWELAGLDDPILFWHAHFALCRCGKRLPEAALAAIRAGIPDSSVIARCGFAEQLIALGDLEGVTAALLELLHDFARIGHQKDAPVLLMLVTHGLAARREVARVQELMARHNRHLSKDGREWYREMTEDEEFLPMIVRNGLDALDIEDVVLQRELLEDEEEEEDEDEEGDDEEGEDRDFDEGEDLEDADEWEDEYFPEPVVKPVRPGRNDPCWCGSGKKYKKCHLDADEIADRGGAA